MKTQATRKRFVVPRLIAVTVIACVPMNNEQDSGTCPVTVVGDAGDSNCACCESFCEAGSCGFLREPDGGLVCGCGQIV